MVRLRVGPLLILGLLAAAPARAAQAAADSIVVIVHPDVPATRITVAEARRIFLRRSSFWSDRRRIEPVNLPATSPVRDTFSRRVLGRAPAELAAYWNDRYFHGTSPPPVLESEQAMLLYVARTPGAIGYVRASAVSAGATVRVVLVLPP